MNYLARICLGALSSPLIFPLPTFFSLQFPFDLRLFFLFFFFPEPRSSPPKRLFFSTAPVPIAPGTFLQGVAGSAGKVICKANFVPEAAAKKSLYSLILCVSLCKKKIKKSTAREKVWYDTSLPNKLVPPPH